MRKRVVVAMSGGVDSSVAAALLKRQGYEVIGITMCFSAYGGSNSGRSLAESIRKKPTCCGIQGIEDARRVCHKLGIRHYVLNMQKDLEKYVIKDFCQEYLKGRTPNPCIRCNERLKFDILLKKALSLDASFLATGHYARIVRSQGHKVTRSQVYILKKGKDGLKDQSYFLYRLSQSQLEHILFPIGDYTKTEVRKLAKEFALPVADKLASQEICFLPDADYRGFLKLRMTTAIKPGVVTDKYGNVLGQHRGIAFYTIGQREGLGIAMGYPAYVIKIEHKNNRIVLGKKEDAYKREFMVKDIHFIHSPLEYLTLQGKDEGRLSINHNKLWPKGQSNRGLILPTPKKKIAARVKIRYNHQEAWAEISPMGSKIKARFRKPQFAITPGQSAVFYDKDTVFAGGVIERVSD